MNIFVKEFNFFCWGGGVFFYKLTRIPFLTKNFFFSFFFFFLTGGGGG